MSRTSVFLSGTAVVIAVLVFVLAGMEPAPLPGRVTSTATVVQPAPSGGSADDSTDLHLFGLGREHVDDDAQLDLQGDEVTPAVANYRFDAQGNIYETHAPHTEVPRLGSPSS